MHIAEGFLPAAHAAGWSLAAVPFIWHAARQVGRQLRQAPDFRLALAAATAFTLALSALKLPSVTGSCSHPTGTGLGAMLVGAGAMPLLGLIVLSWQALFLAHGGISTLGANLVAMAVVGPWTTVALATGLRRAGARPSVVVGGATGAGSLATYLTTAMQLALAFPDSAGGVLVAFVKFATLFGVSRGLDARRRVRPRVGDAGRPARAGDDDRLRPGQAVPRRRGRDAARRPRVSGGRSDCARSAGRGLVHRPVGGVRAR